MKYQQGDVIIKASIIPKDAELIAKKPLAIGEVSGHSHQVVEDCEMYEKDGVLYITSSNQMTVKHEEHTQIVLPAGDYQIGIVKEFDPFLEETRRVID